MARVFKTTASAVAREIVASLQRERGMNHGEALLYFRDASPRTREQMADRVRGKMAKKRREALGNPVYKPRQDYVGGPAR